MNPITFSVLVHTAEFEIGLSFLFLLGLDYCVPWLKARADKMWEHTKPRWVHPNRVINFFWFSKYLGVKGWRQEERQYRRYPKWFILDRYGQGFAWLMLGLVVMILATSVGLINHTSLPYAEYYFLFARANGAPNGAHIPSYLSVSILGLVAAWATRDFWFGAATTAFAYAIHEGLWLPLEYIAYLPYYLHTSVLINVERDLIFSASILIVAVAYVRYPLRKIPLKAFAVPVVLYGTWLGVWFFLPPLLGAFPHLPITTINNPILGLGVFQETPWYANPLPNFFESGSWMLLSSGLALSVILWRKRRQV